MRIDPGSHAGNEGTSAVTALPSPSEMVHQSYARELEQRFTQICGTDYAIAVASGTAALHISLLACGVVPGDEVIVTPFTDIASVNSILYTGAKPVFVDIEEDTFDINAELIENAITPNTKAIMAVHLFGHMCDMDALAVIAAKHHLGIVEDGCQALGATCRGKPAGSFGVGAFSLSTLAAPESVEGGVITTSDRGIAEHCRLICSNGMNRKNEQEVLGYNYRMTELRAAVGLDLLERLPGSIERRCVSAHYLNARIKRLATPIERVGYGHAWYGYMARVTDGQDRDRLVLDLRAAGIDATIPYPTPVYSYPHVWQVVGEMHLPIAERLAKSALSLPMRDQLSESELERIVSVVNHI